MKLHKYFLLITFLLLLSSFVSAIVENDTNVKLYYSFDNVSHDGSTIYDLTNNNYDGSITQITEGKVGIYEQSFYFDGTTDYITRTNSDWNALQNFSINFWTKPENKTGAVIYSYGKGVTSTFYGFHLSRQSLNRMSFFVGRTGGYYDTLTDANFFTDGEWQMITLVYSNRNIKFYKNGVSLKNSTIASDILYSASFDDLRIGDFVDSTGYGYMGNLDELSFWNKALNSYEINYLYNNNNFTIEQQFPFIVEVIISSFSITAIETRNNQSITNFSVLINGNTYNTTNGTINTNILKNSTSLYNITFFGIDNHFNRTYININVSSNLEGEIYRYPRFSVKNYWNSSYLISFNATINGTTYTSVDDIDLFIPLNNSVASAFVCSPNHFCDTKTLNLTPDNTLETTLYQSIINVTPKLLILNTSISNFSLYLNGSLVCNTTLDYCLIYPNAGTYTATIIDNTGEEEFHTTSNTLNVTALDNKTFSPFVHGHELFIMARTISNATINNFSVTITSLNISDTRTLSTTTGVINFDVIHNTYNYTVDAEGYALSNNTGQITISSVQRNYTRYVYLQITNSINFTFYEENNPNTILNGINISFILLNGGAYEYNTSVGWKFLSNLISGDYEIKYGSLGYDDRSYYFTVTNRSTQNIVLYLSNATNTENYIIRVADLSDVNIIGATVRLQRQMINLNGTFVTIEECVTSDTGQCDMYIQESSSINYRFIVIINGEVVKTTETLNIVNIPSQTKTITLRVDTGTSIYQAFQDVKNVFYNLTLTNNITTWNVIDSGNVITGACLNIQRRQINNNTRVTIYNVCQNSSTVTLSKDITSYLINDTIIIINGQIYYNDGSLITLETIQVKTSTKGSNIDKNDELIFLAIIFVFISLLTILIPNLIIQTLMNFGLLFFADLINIGSLGKVIIIGFMILGIIINYNKRNISVTGV